MISINNSRCPICGTLYIQDQKKCKKCFWNLTIYSQNYQLSSAEIITKHEYWAKNAYKRANEYLKEKNILIKKMEESKKLKNKIFELELRISELEKQLDSLSNQETRSNNLKQEILLELQSTIKNKIEESLHNLSSQNQDYQSINFGKNSNIIEMEFIENQSLSPPKNFNNLEVNETRQINPYEHYVIDQYYHNPNFLVDHAYKVTPTKKTLENIYLNKANEIIFQESNQSDYWIVELKTGGYFLLPDLNLKINTNLKTVKTIFELQKYQDNLSKNFQIIKTAKVNKINNQWELIDRGILQF